LAGDDQTPMVRLMALRARLDRWQWTMATNRPLAAEDRAAAQGALVALDAAGFSKSRELSSLLKIDHMLFTYLVGDMAQAERLYAELRQANNVYSMMSTVQRDALCARLAQLPVSHCAAPAPR